MAMNNHHEMEIPGFIPVQKRDSLGKAHLAGPSDDINLPSKPGRSGPELIASIPDPTLEGYIARFNADNIEETFQQVGIPVKQPRTSVFGVGHAVKPGTIDFAMRDGLLYVLLPGKHAYRCHGLQPRPYVVERTISFSEDAASRASGYHEFEGGCIVTLGPSEVGFAYNVPSHCESVEMGRGVVLIPPGTWVIRAPIHLAKNNFEATTTGRRVGSTITYVQEVNVGVMELAKPRLVYVPYNHCAMFIDGSSSVICKQGFHWANPGLEIAGPWAQNEQRYTHTIRAKTLDNMSITIEAECWVQMVNPKMYVRVAGKEMLPQTFVEDKLTAKVKQHVAAINALQLRSVEATASPAAGAEDADNDFEYLGDPGPLVPVQGEPLPSAAAGEAQAQAKEDDVDNIIVTKPEDSPTEFQVFNRMQCLLDEVRGFVDGRHSSVVSLAAQVQEAISRAGLQLISLAALSVNLPDEITTQIQQANEEQIIAQTEQATNHAKAQKHIAEKYAEIRKKKADREEETKDAENQVVLQKAKARLAEAEEFAKRQAKRAEQKVEQSLELQALEHKMIREQTRIDNELRLLQKEAELVAKQEEMEAKRLSLARAIQERENLEADVAAYKLTTEARALRERVNQQTLVDTVMKNLGKPMEGSRILTINGGSGAAGQEGGNTGSMAMLPQMVALKEILGQCNELDRQAPHAPLPSSGYGSHISSSSHGRQ
jgi:hypothetical protein